MLTDSSSYVEASVGASERQFLIRAVRFDNGAFISINDGKSAKLGAMVVSIASTGMPVTTSVIPAKSDSMFLKLVAETVSSRVRGISIVTLSSSTDIPHAMSRAILEKIMELV